MYSNEEASDKTWALFFMPVKHGQYLLKVRKGLNSADNTTGAD